MAGKVQNSIFWVTYTHTHIHTNGWNQTLNPAAHTHTGSTATSMIMRLTATVSSAMKDN